MPESTLFCVGAAKSKRSIKYLVATIFVVAACFCMICGKVLFDARQAAWERASEVAASLVATLESDIMRTIESYDLSLHGVVENLEFPEITQVSPALRQALLFDRSATAKHLDSIVLLDEKGIVRLDSRTPYPELVSRAERDYFEYHKRSNDPELHISRPIIARSTGAAVLAISRRLSNPDGSFAGVVVGSIRLSYFQQLFKEASLGLNGNITLAHTDGTLLMRWPYQEVLIGRDLKGAELYKHLAVARSGRFESNAVTDGVRRLVVYRQVGDLPLVIGIGQSTEDIYAPWRRYALVIGALMALLCAMTVVLALCLARETRRRDNAETALAVLATTDSLTGLANRRRFNDILDREWHRANREHMSLSLIMMDADLFKNYNDLHGHQTGDKLLQAIGAAMQQSLRRGTDVAARYGGDEFAMLLPSTSSNGSVQIAELVRSRLASICDERRIPGSPLSIGVASAIPRPGQEQGTLLTAADEALYRAKNLGRNRIEVAATFLDTPPLVPGIGPHAAVEIASKSLTHAAQD
jgi:diguanylate cyclase (GGDEF)-like protein